MKNSSILCIILLLVNCTVINASRNPELRDVYLFSSKEHIKTRLKNIGLVELTQRSNIVNDLFSAQIPLDIATAIEIACHPQLFSLREAISIFIIKNKLYQEFFQDYRDHLKLLQKAAREGNIDINIPNVIPHQK